MVEKDGKEFDFGKYKNLSTRELIQKGVLPAVDGLYNDATRLIDGVILSHAHADHFGLMNFLNPEIPVYLGEATHEILKLNNIFLGQKYHISHPNYFDKGKPFKIWDFTITPFWADHSAFDAYSFLIETGGKSIFYSGDFRSHGRKAGAFNASPIMLLKMLIIYFLKEQRWEDLTSLSKLKLKSKMNLQKHSDNRER